MKQYIRRVLLVLCLAAGMLSLSACGSAAEKAAVDPQMATYVSQATEGLLEQIGSLDEAQTEELETSLLDAGEDGLASVVTAWSGTMQDTGKLVAIISSDVELSDDGEYVCTVQAQFEKRNAEFKLFCVQDRTTQTLTPTSASMSPEYTLGEKMAKAAMNTLLGMGTVFVVLIFISVIIGCFKFISVFEQRAKNKAAASAAAPAPAAEPAAEEEELADDLELVAVITAAIAASTGASADGLVVRSIKRAPGSKWKRA
ncbi:MAG: OadG family protein [Eubacteriales bacterium]|nr:OadG family protein [Eubacteriales bacterium]